MNKDFSEAPKPPALPPTQTLIAGRRLEGGHTFAVHDRFTGMKVADVTAATREHVAQAVRAARTAFVKSPPPYDRSKILRRVADMIDTRRDALIELMVTEVGFTPPDGTGATIPIVSANMIILEASGMALPASWSGYPVPSQFS